MQKSSWRTQQMLKQRFIPPSWTQTCTKQDTCIKKQFWRSQFGRSSKEQLVSPRPHEAVTPQDIPEPPGHQQAWAQPPARTTPPLGTTSPAQREAHGGERRGPMTPSPSPSPPRCFWSAASHHRQMGPGTWVRAVPFQHQSCHHHREAEAGCDFNTCLDTAASDHKGKATAERDPPSPHVGGTHISHGVQEAAS